MVLIMVTMMMMMMMMMMIIIIIIIIITALECENRKISLPDKESFIVFLYP